MPVPEEANINNKFHSIITAEEWKINKLDVAELYLNDSMQPEQELDSWHTMDGLTIMYVPGYGKLQMIWIEDDNDQRT